MRKLYKDITFRESLVKNAEKHITELLSAEKAAEQIKQRVDTLYSPPPIERV